MILWILSGGTSFPRFDVHLDCLGLKHGKEKGKGHEKHFEILF
jgi:hypothetical protein